MVLLKSPSQQVTLRSFEVIITEKNHRFWWQQLRIFSNIPYIFFMYTQLYSEIIQGRGENMLPSNFTKNMGCNKY